jgi:hypothetical protein
MAKTVVQVAQTSAIPIRLTSTNVPQTLAEGIAALSTDTTQRLSIDTGSPERAKDLIGGTILVSTNPILISNYGGVPTVVDFISTTLTAVAVADAGSVTSAITGITANQVTLTPASMTGIQAGMKVVITVTDNYNGTFFVESVTSTTFNIASALTAETTSTSDLVKTVNTGIPIASGDSYDLRSTEDIRQFRYVSAVTDVHGTLDIDLTFGG